MKNLPNTTWTAHLRAGLRKHTGTFIAGVLCAVVAFVLVNVLLERTSRSEYCGGECHEMKAAYRTWELSAHGANRYGYRVECVDCHLPPKDMFFRHVAAKGYAGLKDTLVHYFGGKYDSEKMRQKVLAGLAPARCLHCHDELLAKPASSAARTAHIAVLAAPDEPQNRCPACHEQTGHQREKKLFSP